MLIEFSFNWKNGVQHTSLAALILNLFGTFFTLWLAVLLRRFVGTCWNALVLKACLESRTLLPIA